MSIARGGSQHIEFLLDKKLLKTSTSTILRMAYAEAKMQQQLSSLKKELEDLNVESIGKATPSIDGEKMLLNKSSAQLIADQLEIPELAVEIKRAVWQVERSLKAKQEYREEKKEIETATKKSDR